MLGGEKGARSAEGNCLKFSDERAGHVCFTTSGSKGRECYDTQFLRDASSFISEITISRIQVAYKSWEIFFFQAVKMKTIS